MMEWNDDLEVMESFVLEGKRFTRLPEEEVIILGCGFLVASNRIDLCDSRLSAIELPPLMTGG